LPVDTSTESCDSGRGRKASMEIRKTPMRPSTVGRNQSSEFRIRPTSIRSSRKSAQSVYQSISIATCVKTRHNQIKEMYFQTHNS